MYVCKWLFVCLQICEAWSKQKMNPTVCYWFFFNCMDCGGKPFPSPSVSTSDETSCVYMYMKGHASLDCLYVHVCCVKVNKLPLCNVSDLVMNFHILYLNFCMRYHYIHMLCSFVYSISHVFQFFMFIWYGIFVPTRIFCSHQSL